MGQLIGRGGAHIRALEAKTGAFIETRDGLAIVHAQKRKALSSAVAELQKYTHPQQQQYISPYNEGYDELVVDEGYGPMEYGYGDYDREEEHAYYDTEGVWYTRG
jgi:hypothetical protein